MNKKTKNKKEYNFVRETLFPACAIFCAAVFIFFIVAWGMGQNVTESKTEIITVFDNDLGTNESNGPAKPRTLSVESLFGILLFSFALTLLGLLFKLDYNKLTLRLAHFSLTVVSFFVFVLALPGYVAEAGLPAGLLTSSAVGIGYFILLGIKTLVMKIKPLRSPKLAPAIAFIMPVFTIFTGAVFVISLFNLMSQSPVIVKEIMEEVFEASERIKTVYVRVVTPFAPTLQNYFRYLLSGLIFMVGYAIMKMNLHTVVRWSLNFTILTAGYVGIWIVGMDYFRMLPAKAVPAVVIYLAVYLAILVTVCIVNAVKRRENEDYEDYEQQFRPSGKASVGDSNED